MKGNNLPFWNFSEDKLRFKIRINHILVPTYVQKIPVASALVRSTVEVL